MKRFKIKTFLAGIMMMFMASNASAALLWTHVCYAESPNGFGFGYSTSSRAQASSIALNECSMNTAYFNTCFIKWCDVRLINWN